MGTYICTESTIYHSQFGCLRRWERRLSRAACKWKPEKRNLFVLMVLWKRKLHCHFGLGCRQIGTSASASTHQRVRKTSDRPRLNLLYFIVRMHQSMLFHSLLISVHQRPCPCKLGNAPLHHACCKAPLDAVSLLVNKNHPVALSVENKHGATSLHVPWCNDAPLNVVSLLVEKGTLTHQQSTIQCRFTLGRWPGKTTMGTLHNASVPDFCSTSWSSEIVTRHTASSTIHK